MPNTSGPSWDSSKVGPSCAWRCFVGAQTPVSRSAGAAGWMGSGGPSAPAGSAESASLRSCSRRFTPLHGPRRRKLVHMIDALVDLGVVDPEREPRVLNGHVEAVLVIVGAGGRAALSGLGKGGKVDGRNPAPALGLLKERYRGDVIDRIGAVDLEIHSARRIDLHLLHLDEIFREGRLVVVPDLLEVRVQEACVLLELVDANDERSRLPIRRRVDPTRREEREREGLRRALLRSLRRGDGRRAAQE